MDVDDLSIARRDPYPSGLGFEIDRLMRTDRLKSQGEDIPLEEFPLLNRCSEAGLEKLRNKGQMIDWREGQEIVHEGMPTDGIYFILAGKMKVITQGILAQSQIIRLAAERDIVGHRGINEKEVFPVGIDALTDCRTFFIDLEFFYELLKTEAPLSFEMMFFFANELMGSENRMKRLARLYVRERVADALLYIRSKFGSGSKWFPLPLSRYEIGDLAGTNSDQVSRCLSEFKKEGRIELQKGWIALRDPDHLERLSQRE